MGKMQNKNSLYVLLIFFVAIVFRLYFVLQTPYFSDDVSYYNIKNINAINEQGKPLFDDPLSFGGASQYFPPLFFYFMSFFSFFFGKIAFKVVPVIFLSLIAVVVYLISKQITEDENAALLSSFISVFIPITISETLNKVSAYSLSLFIIFFMVYCLMKIQNKFYLAMFVILSILLPLIHPIAFLLSISLIFYAILLNVEFVKLNKLIKEAILFYIFISLLVEFIFFKQSFINLGFNAIWQNIPSEIFINFYRNISVLEVLFQIGAISLIFGIIGIVFGVFKYKKDSVFLIYGIILATALLLLLKLIDFSVGMVFLGISLTIASSLGFEKLFKYIRITKFSNFENHIKFLLLLIVLFTFVWPSYSNAGKVISNALTDDEYYSFIWLKNNTLENSTILSSPYEGNYITSIANRKSFIDRNFLFYKNINNRFLVVKFIFKSESKVKSLELLKKYNIGYIYLSERTKRDYGINKIKYIRENDECFKRVFRTEKTEIYRKLC